jgi:hypothetical protein
MPDPQPAFPDSFILMNRNNNNDEIADCSAAKSQEN